MADKADSQDLCFLAGTDRARFLARHGGIGDRPGAIVDRDGNVLGRHRGQHLFTVGQRRGIGVDGGGPLYVLDKDADRGRVTVGPRAALRADRRGRPRRQPAPRRRSGGPGQAPLPLAPAAGEAGRGPAGGTPPALSIELDEPVDGAAPGQLACLMDGELVVGWGTITALEARRRDWDRPGPTLRCPMTSDEIRRTFIEFFEQRDHRRLPSASLVPAEHDPSALFTVAGHASAQALLPGRRAAAAPAR